MLCAVLFAGMLACRGTSSSTDVPSVTASDCRKLSKTAATVHVANTFALHFTARQHELACWARYCFTISVRPSSAGISL